MIKENMNKIIKELKKKYRGNFVIQEEPPAFDVILFDNKELNDNKDFLNYTFELAEKYLDEEGQLKFTLCYDYNNEINNIIKEDG